MPAVPPVSMNRLMNAGTVALRAATVRTLADFQADPAVRLCVMTGAGDKAFVSGADIGGLKPGGREGGAAPSPALSAFDALGAFEKPLVAMIRGWCLGGGVAIAMKADIRICATDARFGIPAALIPLLWFCARRDLMGELVNRRATTITAALVASIIVILNVVLLLLTFGVA